MAKDSRPHTVDSRQEEQKQEQTEQEPQDTGLIVMFKGDEKIAVHPTTVKSHEIVGWKVQK
jgi:hypothetical protein